MPSTQGYIAVDLDGTLAEYNGWVEELHIGPPIPMDAALDSFAPRVRDGFLLVPRLSTHESAGDDESLE